MNGGADNEPAHYLQLEKTKKFAEASSGDLVGIGWGSTSQAGTMAAELKRFASLPWPSATKEQEKATVQGGFFGGGGCLGCGSAIDRAM